MNLCPNCTTPTDNPRFCSRSCSATFTNREAPKRKRIQHICACGAEMDRRARTCRECSLSSRTEFSKVKTLKECRDYVSAKGRHPSWAYSHVRAANRAWNKELTDRPCSKCGYSIHVELCHIRAVTDFPETATLGEVNDPRNLVPLCRNCHWELDHGLWALPAGLEPT